MAEPEQPDTPLTEDVGKQGECFRLWRAQQAIRLGELSLSEQEKSRDSLSKLAVSLMGWAISIAIVLLGAAIKTDQPLPFLAAAITGGLCSFVAALFCHLTFRMKNWEIPGVQTDYFLTFGETGPNGEETDTTEYCTELDTLNGIALGYAKAFHHNEEIIQKMAVRVRMAWTAFLAIPVLTLTGWIIFSVFY